MSDKRKDPRGCTLCKTSGSTLRHTHTLALHHTDTNIMVNSKLDTLDILIYR